MSQNCMPLWRNAHLKVKMLKNCSLRNTFWRSTVEKLPGAVAKRTFASEKSTFASQNVQNMTASEHFCLFRCRKIARRCGEKHIWKSKCTKHRMFGPLLSVQMSKNCMPLWWKAHLEVKMLKNCSLRSIFWRSAVEKLHAAVVKSTFGSENVQKL